ncbi:hypothetical protein GMORB2_7620 [Geosmithia morbida]|uniref:Uncharacterized protein n=1 Tax=Geosmithia morbida TaxID=1094350 RepID=A0A9P5D0U8_9HYPO|nr:uncharacterized protein GMORB2_7620 [Geosmithia morbida]KAF4122027.1 hypothetical protein GMORB2_7620 [Geosmithia morbida]
MTIPVLLTRPSRSVLFPTHPHIRLTQIETHHKMFRSSRSSSPDDSYVYNTSRRSSSTDWSDRSCKDLTDDRTRNLWRCMLYLQEHYACYHSARIDVAMEAGDESDYYMPSRFIIDTLNESVIDTLPDQAWELLNQFLHP